MTLRKGLAHHELRKRVSAAHELLVKIDTNWRRVCLLKPEQIEEMYDRAEKRGESTGGAPMFAAYRDDPALARAELVIFPIPAQDYKCEFVGVILVVQ